MKQQKKQTRQRWILQFTFILLFTCLTVVLTITPASAAIYPDIQGHWAQAAIEKWSDSDVLTGYPDGTFGPNSNVTRAQLAVVLYRIWGADPIEGFTYPDLSPDDWCYESLTTMNAYGIALNTDDRIYPDEPLTREEAFYMIAKAFFVGIDQDIRESGMGFKKISDDKDISDRYTDQIEEMLHHGFIHGYADGALHPKYNITRAEVMTVLDNMVDNYIFKPGEYTVQYGQDTLITSSGVKLNIICAPAGYVLDSYNLRCTYLMGDAAENGVTFCSPDTNERPSSALIYSVSQEKPTWQTDGKCTVNLKENSVLSTRALPDFRFAGGRGRIFFPYIISTPEQFMLLAEQNNSSNYNNHFKLACDIDLSALQAPIGLDDELLIHAKLDGGGHTINYCMNISSFNQPFAGLFYAWSGSCSNLLLTGSLDVTLSDVAAKATNSGNLQIGGFSGYLKGSMTNCSSSMEITARYGGSTVSCLSVGGLIGRVSHCNVQGCSSSGSVNAILSNTYCKAAAGGIVGSTGSYTEYGPGCTFSGCGSSATVYVSGGLQTFAGGIVGLLTVVKNTPIDSIQRNYIEKSWSTSTVSASEASLQSDCGGIVGQNWNGDIRESWSKPIVTVTGPSYQNIGGIAGSCYENSTITDCWANATGCAIGGDLHSGGIVGRLVATVSNCYVLGASQFTSENSIVFKEWNDGTVTNCTNLTDLSQDQKNSFYDSCGWDFASIWDNSGSYPVLRNCDFTAQHSVQDPIV